MKRIFQIAIIAAFALMTLSFTAGVGVTLRLHPQKDKVYTITSKTTQTTTMKVQNQTMRSINSVEGRQSFNVKETSADQIVIETQIEAVKMEVTTMGMTLKYDSEHPETNSPMLAGQTNEIDNILNKPTSITYDEFGVNKDSDDIEMNQLNNVIIELPKEELHVGSQWSVVNSQTVSDIDININMIYTVTSISKKSVELSFSGVIDSKEITGSYEGTSTINPHTGLVMSTTINNSVSVTISEQGFDIPTTIKGNTTITVKEQ